MSGNAKILPCQILAELKNIGVHDISPTRLLAYVPGDTSPKKVIFETTSRLLNLPTYANRVLNWKMFFFFTPSP